MKGLTRRFFWESGEKCIISRWKVVGMAILVMLLLPMVAIAQETGDPGPIQIPFLGQIVGVIVAVFSLVSAIVPDNKMPKIVAQIVNFLALNFANAKNQA